MASSRTWMAPLEPNRWNRVIPPANIVIDTATLGDPQAEETESPRLRTSLGYRRPGDVMVTCVASFVTSLCEHVSVGMTLEAGEESAFLIMGERPIHLLGHYVRGTGALNGGIQAESEDDHLQTKDDASDAAMDDVQRHADQANSLPPENWGGFRASVEELGDRRKQLAEVKGKDRRDEGTAIGTSSRKRKASTREDGDQEAVEDAPVHRKRRMSAKPDGGDAEYKAPAGSRRKESAGPDIGRLSTLRNRSLSRTPSVTMEVKGGMVESVAPTAPQDPPSTRTWSFSPSSIWKRR